MLKYQILIVAGLTVIIFFAVMNIGTFMNSTIEDKLTDDYAGNTASGNFSDIRWDNDTANDATNSYQMNISTDVDNLLTASSAFYIRANATAVDYNLTVNGQNVRRNDNLSEGTGQNTTFAYLITNTSINASDQTLTFDWQTSDSGSMIVRIIGVGTYFNSSDYRTNLENRTWNSMVNLSGGYDDTLDSIVIAALIMAITLPLMAVLVIRKFF